MKELWNDNNIKKNVIVLLGIYMITFLLIMVIDILEIYVEFESLRRYKYIVYKLMICIIIFSSAFIGYRTIKYIYTRLSTVNKNVTLAINGNYDSTKEYVSDYDEGILYSIEYQLNTLICKLNSNRECVNNEKKRLNTLVTEITHQLKTPVAAIKLFNSLLQNNEIGEEKKLNMISKMSDEIHKVEWFVESLTDISKLETGLIQINIKENNINKTITEAVNSIYVSAREKDIEINMKNNHNNIFCYDAKWTKEAITNILDNAVKYTDIEGTITIECVKTVMSNKIIINDNGRGIDKNDIPFIFDRFYKSDKTGIDKGIGIGLYLAKEIMKSQDGTIKVYSELDKGSRFELIFYS
ncbi:hypothetical protein SH1V18_37770 [Vallitalea longa]|uniref:histidine kinase n=1 Tax=Vallitalea longa TaxID=2936439 RepID=A0A9W5YC62_9FIRM|nr:HAMP domain-containing sensor histidine kinase [Vallitalea longa]GKX31297.1 hypothetical protein SH1V18_37770 [Vallitalea longa]